MLLQLPSLWDFPQSHWAVLQSWAPAQPCLGACSLRADGFFLFACSSSWPGPPSTPSRRFSGPFCYFPPFLLLLTPFSDQMLGCALWSSAILCLEASRGGVLRPGGEMLFGRRMLLGRKGKLHPALQRAGGSQRAQCPWEHPWSSVAAVMGVRC